MQLRYIHKTLQKCLYGLGGKTKQNLEQYETDNQNFFQQKQLHQEHLKKMKSKENFI